MSSQDNIGSLLDAALQKLHQTERFNQYLQYLNSEWYYTTEDLRLAHEDEKVWLSLKLPGRLKIELATLLDEQKHSQNRAESKNDTEVAYNDEYGEYGEAEAENGYEAPDEDTVANGWVKCWAPEHACYYFYNTVTEESSWEDPRVGNDPNHVYDVYQYSDAEQKWVVVADDNSPTNAGTQGDDSNPFSITPKKTAGRSPNRGESKQGNDPSPRKWDFKSTGARERDAGASSQGPGQPQGFSRPRITPKAEAGEDVLFTQSPNRPRIGSGGKSLPATSPDKREHKSTHRYTVANKPSPRNKQPTPASDGAAGAGDVLSRRGVRHQRPVRLQLSSDDSASDDNQPATPPRSGTKDGSARDKADEKRHSPMNSKPLSRPTFGAAVDAQALHSCPKKVVDKAGGVQQLDSEAKAAPARLAYRRHPSHMYDWDSKDSAPAASSDAYTEPGAPAVSMAAPSTDAEPYDFYKDYHNTEAEEVVPEAAAGAYADGYGGYDYGNTADGYDYYNYDQQEGKAAEDAYIVGDSGNAQGYEGYEGYDYKESEYGEQQGEYAYGGEAYDYYQQETATEEEAGEDTVEEEVVPYDEYLYDAYGGQPSNRSWGAADSARRQGHAYEENYYSQAAEPSAPPAEEVLAEDAPIARFSPSKSSRGGTSSPAAPKQFTRHDPALYYSSSNGSSRRREDKSVSPVVRAPMDNSPVATPVRYEPETDDFYLVEATADYITPRDPDFPQDAQYGGAELMSMALGSPGSNTATPVQQPSKSKKNTITKLFRLNLFGKGPALPSTPPPPRDNSRDGDVAHSANPHSSAYRQAKMLERKQSRQSNKSNNSSSNDLRAAGSNPSSSAPSSAKSGSLNLRRKPQPAAPDSELAVASRERYHAAHLPHQQQAHMQAQRPYAYASKKEEAHYRSLQRLMDMGFDESECILALNMCDDDMEGAAQMLLEGRGR